MNWIKILIEHILLILGHDLHQVWSRLLSDKSSLQQYSHAMRTLATEHWPQGSEDASRVAWCVSMCEQYFSEQGYLHTLLLKDLRRQSHNMPTLVSPQHLPLTALGVVATVEEWKGRKVQLLDVGSCYNPFGSFPQFEVTAIDIAPAHKVCSFFSLFCK